MSKPRAYIIKADGEEVVFEPSNGTDYTLEEMHRAVGGFIEVHLLPDGKLIGLNEDAIAHNLPQNAAATIYAHNLNTGPKGIQGDVLICDDDMIL